LPTRSEFPELEMIRGGVQLEVAEHLGFQINFFSKIASRVLLRIAKFEARYFDQFEKAFAQVDFEKYFTPQELRLKVESHKSRLNNEKNIIEAATNVLKKKKFSVNDESLNTIYIRLEKDRVTVSLDTSGEHLHKRGYAVYRGEAPLRETLAAYLIKKLQQHITIDQNLTIIDPFVGSGTILFEASSFGLPNLERSYSWLNFKNAPKLFKSETWKKNYRWFENQKPPHCLGFDLDEKAIASLEKNKIEFNKIFKQSPLDITPQVQDSRDLVLNPAMLRKNVWVLANPPYGIRLADENAKQALENLETNVDGMIVIHPVAWNFKFKKMSKAIIEDFSNQGLNLKLSVFVKK
ncbi:MAG: hypothetical protein AABY53_02620, partial [Bdellovibrionota bacterium]